MLLAAIKFSIQNMQSTIKRCSGDQKGSGSAEKTIRAAGKNGKSV